MVVRGQVASVCVPAQHQGRRAARARSPMAGAPALALVRRLRHAAVRTASATGDVVGRRVLSNSRSVCASAGAGGSEYDTRRQQQQAPWDASPLLVTAEPTHDAADASGAAVRVW